MSSSSALIRKNWLLYKRGLFGNCLEIILPIFFCSFILLVPRLDPPSTLQQQSFLPQSSGSSSIIDQTMFLNSLKQCPSNSEIGLAPSSSALILKIRTNLNHNGFNTRQFSSQTELQDFVRAKDYKNGVGICWAVVVVDESSTYRYKLRFNISTNGDNDGPSTKLKLTEDFGIDLESYKSALFRGMIGANLLVHNAILEIESGATNQFFTIRIAPAHQQTYVIDNIFKDLSDSVATVALLPLLIIYLRQTAAMLAQKQTKVRQSMRIMGMRMSEYYGTWFIRYIAIFGVVHGACTAIISYQLPFVPFYIPLALFLMFDVLLILQNYFIQIFLSRAKLGVVIALLFFVVQYILSLLSTNSNNPTQRINNLLSIIPHVAFILSFQNLLYFQSKQITASFTFNINNYTLLTAIISFSVNIAVYFVLVWYLDQVVPSEWGAKRHPLFCCCEQANSRDCRVHASDRQEIRQQGSSKTLVEEVQKNFKKMQKENQIIDIVNLSKDFSGDTLAVQNLNMKLYKNQIFALLGHNGAGKTTTISMLTGLIDPSEGFFSVFGQTQIWKIREMIGLCPQHDTLYQDLTVREHLQLFATFKGLQDEQRDRQVQKLIADVNLQEKSEQYSKNLSGGQKRRLSVAIAFAGKSKVIILDEPTSGMDTSARRYIWDMLRTYKTNRIIILTTHFMDEADFLGDRIGIMGNGQLLCCGSSIFLKNQFGIGYNITFVKNNSQTDSQPIIRTVQKHISTAKILSNVSSEVAMQLPLEQIRKFSTLFNQIDNSKDALKISEYGVSITTLEEVFLRVGEQLDQETQPLQKSIIDLEQDQPSSPIKTRAKEKSEDLSSSELELKPRLRKRNGEGANNQVRRPREARARLKQNNQDIPIESDCCSRFSIHFKATLLKRFRVIKRDVKSFLFELILPLAIILAALFLMRVSFIKDMPSQQINLSAYLQEQNPLLVPIGSADSALLTSVKTELNTRYPFQVDIRDTTASATDADFDTNFLFPFKKSLPTLKGGLYFNSTITSPGPIITYPFTSLVITRSPTSCFFLPNLAVQSLINSQHSKTIELSMINHPLPITFEQANVNNTISGFLGSFIFTLALAFKFASIISFIVKQREDRVKYQQIVSGMMLSAYWIANFIYDYLLYLCVAMPAAAFCMLLNVSSLTDGNALPATWMLFTFYGLAYIPLTYLLAFIFKEYGSAQSFYFFASFLTGGLFPVLTLLLRMLSASSNKIGRYIAWGLRSYPAFAFGQGVINLGSVNLYSTNQNGGESMNPLDLQITLGNIFCLVGQFFIYSACLFIYQACLNNQSVMRFCSSEGSVTETAPITESDVVAQYQKANKANPQKYQILTQHLRKVYMIDSNKKYKVAVDDLSLAIKKGEVFGLLGVNGAGKTTTFKMLAGEITSTSGDSYFCGLKISQNLDKIRESLGYCPQFDALIQNLTVREQIQLFYDLKSLSSQFKQKTVNDKLKQLDLERYEHKLSGTLSGGNKRKLSVAIAMIGNPKIIFLDEPSTGMDPKARRFMWKVISRIATQRKQSTIILTTHSMQEAEALSTRLAIMVKGNFQCIGTPQHIKSRYGQGLQIEIKFNLISKRRIEEIINKKKLNNMLIVKQKKVQSVLDILGASNQDKMEISQYGRGSHLFSILGKQHKIDLQLIIQYLEVSNLAKAVVQELHVKFGEITILEALQSFIRLKVTRNPSIGKLFDFFQDRKPVLNIQQYTIKQASVQQIFNSFAQAENDQSDH